jgi:hypothetical protein
VVVTTAYDKFMFDAENAEELIALGNVILKAARSIHRGNKRRSTNGGAELGGNSVSPRSTT